MLENYKPNENSLGLRVKTLIESDLSYCAPLVHNDPNLNRDYLSKLIKASSTYVDAIEDLHDSTFGELFKCLYSCFFNFISK